MNPVRTAVCAAICFISLATLMLLRTVPQSRLWKGYQVLFVTSDTLTEEQASAILSQSGLHDFISRSEDSLSVSSSISPLQVQSVDSYLVRRDAFFSDKSKSAMVFYIPENQTAQLSNAIHALSGFGKTSCGTDGSSSFPYVAAIFCLLFALAGVYLAKRREFFGACAFFLVFFAFMRPMYTVSACAAIALAGLFSLQRLVGRKSFLSCALHAPLIILTLLFPLFILFSSSPLNGILYALTLAGSFSAVVLVYDGQQYYYEKRTSFHPVTILRASRIRIVGSREVILLASSSLCCMLLLVIFLAGGRVADTASSVDRPALPAPVSSRSELPGLDTFYTWAWNTMAFPFRSIYQNPSMKAPQEGETVSVSNYVEHNGRIEEIPQVVMTYNAQFRSSVLNMVKDSPKPSLEKMLLKQGKSAQYGFTKSRGVSTERFALFLLTMCVLITLGYTGYFVLVRRAYGNHN